MIGQIPSPQAVYARAQSELGDLLKAREEIDMLLRRARTADQLRQIQALSETQDELQSELPDRAAEIAALRRGEINLGYIGRIAAFAARMESHLINVRRVRRSMGLGGLGVEIEWKKVAVVGVAVAVGGVILWTAMQPAPRRRR